MKYSWCLKNKHLNIYLVVLILAEPLVCTVIKPEKLTTNFFVNLKHKYVNTENYDSKEFVLKEIKQFRDDFIRLRLKRQRPYYHLRLDEELRILSSNDTDLERLSSFTEYHSLENVTALKDAIIFTQKLIGHEDEYIYTAALHKSKHTDLLTLCTFNKKAQIWQPIFDQEIYNSNKIHFVPYNEGTLICVTHRHLHNKHLCDGLSVYYLDNNIRLHFLQTIDMAAYTNIVLWKVQGEIFLLFVFDHMPESNGRVFETNCPIYVWKENYFSFLQNIITSNARSIEPFEIYLDVFLGVANYQNNYGYKKIYSTIYKYDSQERIFLSYQNLATSGAVFMKHFHIRTNDRDQNFLLIVNDRNTELIYNVIIYKYTLNNYFIPFQSFTLKGKTIWHTMEDSGYTKALLCISNNDKLKLFHYTGWKFSQVNLDHKVNYIPSNLSIIKSLELNRKTILVTTNEKRNAIVILKPTYESQKNDLHKIKTTLSSWCESVKNQISCLETSLIDLSSNSKGKSSSEIFSSSKNRLLELFKMRQKLELKKVVFGKIKTNAIFSQDAKIDKTLIDNLNNLHSILTLQNTSIKILEHNLKNKLPKRDDVLQIDSLHVGNLEINNRIVGNLEINNRIKRSCQLGPTEIESLNGFQCLQFQNEILKKDFDKNILYDVIEFEKLIVTNSLQLNTINGFGVEQLPILEYAGRYGVNVSGNVYFTQDIKVEGKIDNVNISKRTILLSNEDQIFTEHFDIPHMDIVKLDAQKINDMTREALKEIVEYENKTFNKKYMTNKLTVDDIYVEGDINHLVTGKLFGDILKLSGEQIIFGNLLVSNLETRDIISINKPSLTDDMILIDDGRYIINQDVRFDNLNLKEIIVGERLNNIPVIKGVIQVLLLDSEKMQRVTGDKIFNNVQLMGPFNLQGKINSPSLERKNPITMIDKPITLAGNYIINGMTTIEKLLKIEDLQSPKIKYSLKEIYEKSLKLSEKIIPMHVIFIQPLKVNNLQTQFINGQDTSKWAYKSYDKQIRGKKTFLKNLHVYGECSVDNVNGYNIKELEETLLKIDRDQIIYGVLSVNNVAARRLYCEKARLGNKFIEEILTNDEKVAANGQAFFRNGASVYKNLFVKNLDIKGFISGIDINHMLYDTVMPYSSNVELYGEYNFMELLKIQHLQSSNTFGLPSDDGHIKKSFNGLLNTENLQITNYPVFIKRIIFNRRINGILKKDFGNNWLLTEGDQAINSKQYFSKLTAKEAYLISDSINNMNIKEMYNNCIWIFDNVYLKNVLFKNDLIVKGDIQTKGLFNSLKLPEDVILKSSKSKTQHMRGKKIVRNLHTTDFLRVKSINNITLQAGCD